MRRHYRLFSLLAVLSGVAFAACPDVTNSAGYIRQGASGTASGADWTNAFTVLPATLSRGCTYYVAAGTYAGHRFNDAVSASTVITVQAPTVSVHGIATGWSNAFVGAANFNTTVTDGSTVDIILFDQPFYVFDGAYRNTDWKSGYGFHADASSGNVGSASAVVELSASNITVRNTDVEGSHSQGAPQDRGVQSFGNSNLLVDQDYIHDVGNATMLFRGSCPSSCNSVASNITLQYSYVSVDFSNPAVGHAEGISFAEGVDNIAWRYNKFVNINGTGAMANASSHTATQDAFNGPFYIYGNLFWLDDAFWPSWYATWCQVGGFYANINIKNNSDIYVYNNTIGNVSDNTGGCQSNGASHDGGIHFDDDGLSGGSAINSAVDHAKNNIWWNSPGGVTTGNIPVGQQDIANNTEGVAANKFVLTSTPFNFHLASHIVGSTLANVGTYWNGTALVANTFNVDMDGNTRTTWDQGAFELVSGTPQVATPTFSPVAGTYGTTQSVTITSATVSAVICYTTDGTTPAANGAGACTLGTTLANGGVVSVATSSTVQALGTMSGDTDSAVGSATYTIGTPVASLAPASLSFGGVNVSTTSASQTLTLQNTGTAVMSITSISLTGANTGDFFQSNNCPVGSNLGNGASCTITVTFTPLAVGARAASVSVADGATGSPHTSTLSGTGVQASIASQINTGAKLSGRASVK